MRILACIFLVFAGLPAGALGLEVPERRREQFGRDFSYFLYPIAADIPGLGKAAGGGATVLNMFRTDADFTGFNVSGDFKASGYVLLDMHLIKKRLVLDAGYADYDVAGINFKRGIHSSHDDYILPQSKGYYAIGQLTGTFWERRFEAYVRTLRGRYQLLSVRDKDGNRFPINDTEKRDMAMDSVGVNLDLTDDRLDPRRGFRFEAVAKKPYYGGSDVSRFFTTDYNVTGYLPMRRWDALVLNAYGSDAHITRRASTDYAELQKTIGLGCTAMPPGPDRDRCEATESSFINEHIALNRHGTASSLGGTQRLRSYENGRFSAGHAQFFGAEYRWNLTDEKTPFNLYFAKGVRTGIQVAVFGEAGTVFDKESDRWKDYKSSYGLGFRVVLSGVVIRADAAHGSEGGEFILFITYPWSMFSVDSPS